MKTEVMVLREIAEIAKKYCDDDTNLKIAFNELNNVIQKREQTRTDALEHRGQNCLNCGRRFLPLDGDMGFCSIGCRLVKLSG